MISGKSESNHYICPICSLLQEEVRTLQQNFMFPESPILIGEQNECELFGPGFEVFIFTSDFVV